MGSRQPDYAPGGVLILNVVECLPDDDNAVMQNPGDGKPEMFIR